MFKSNIGICIWETKIQKLFDHIYCHTIIAGLPSIIIQGLNPNHTNRYYMDLIILTESEDLNQGE